ncbi:MFS transporter [Pararhodobacter marinus]|uniref:MFS transporter n=1 Tax=Pararhodobacter marinus TaxID=2184063 RepID=A0A2U2CI73_9RHOB|nr:tripartite tricarboxylate transporter substrate binding protein [Pararhodobacter marinus]PWE31474.1 MFS transporter [Pararhodobacter marinus]
MHPMLATVGAALIAGLAVAGPAAAQGFPDGQDIRLIVPFPPGGPTDTTARLIADQMRQNLGVTIIVDNVPGAGGTIGVTEMTLADPDGHTIAIVGSGAVTLSPFTMPDLPWGPENLTPIIHVVDIPLLMTVPAGFEAQTFGDFVNLVTAHPGDFNYGSDGQGSLTHMSMEWLKSLTGMDLVHIPYRGTADIMQAMLSDTIQTSQSGILGPLPLVQSGELTAIAITSAERSPVLPDVPTVRELGFDDFVVTAWFAFFAPEGTPAEIVDALNASITAAMENPDVSSAISGFGFTPLNSTPAELSQTVDFYLDRWGSLIEGGLQVN